MEGCNFLAHQIARMRNQRMKYVFPYFSTLFSVHQVNKCCKCKVHRNCQSSYQADINKRHCISNNLLFTDLKNIFKSSWINIEMSCKFRVDIVQANCKIIFPSCAHKTILGSLCTRWFRNLSISSSYSFVEPFSNFIADLMSPRNNLK